MNELHAFSHSPLGLVIRGDIRLERAGIVFRFEVADPNKALLDLPESRAWSGAELTRADELWRTTCFEAFFALPGANSYWELNLGGAGSWNLYRFSKYRQPRPPEESEDFSVSSMHAGIGFVEARLECKGPLPTELEASLCAVVRTAHETSYFSTRHAGAKPDFHLRASFSVPVR